MAEPNRTVPNTTGPSREAASIEQARAQVEQSRARIADTLDDIEERLLEKRHELQERLDVRKRVREQIDREPLLALAAAAGVGFLAGMIGRRRTAERDELRAMLDADDDGEIDDIRSISIGRSHPGFWHEMRGQLVGALTATLVAAIADRLRPHADVVALSTEASDEDDDDDALDDDPIDPRRPPRRRRPFRSRRGHDDESYL